MQPLRNRKYYPNLTLNPASTTTSNSLTEAERLKNHTTFKGAQLSKDKVAKMNPNQKFPMIWELKRGSSEQSYERESNLKKRKVVNWEMITNTTSVEKDDVLLRNGCSSIPGFNQRNIGTFHSSVQKSLPSTVTRSGQRIPNIIEDKLPQLLGVPDSLCLNGLSSSKGERQILKKSYRDTIPLPLIRNNLNPLERVLKSPCRNLPQLTKLKLTETGVSPWISGLRHSLSSCPGKSQSYEDTKDTCPVFLLTSTTISTPESSTSIKHVASKLKVKSTYGSMPSPSSVDLKSLTSCRSEWSHSPTFNNYPPPPSQVRNHLEREEEQGGSRHAQNRLDAENLVTTGTAGLVIKPPMSVPGSTSAASVEEVTNGENVPWQRILNELIAHGQHFRRWMIWGEESGILSGTALWTETADPLPRPPPSEFENVPALTTIANNPDLFQVSTPINIDWFETILTQANHPNPPFVRSVCQGLREGFWPWADTQYGTYPVTWDIPSPTPSSSLERDFLHSQILKEESVGRYSRNFEPNLLAAMYSMPIHAVPKEGGKFCLVTNHSAAYRHMPMHPLWQIKQIVSFDGEWRVDRANVFGGRASQRIFHAFMSLIIWIAVFIRLIQAFIYIDDSFSFAK
ncbi:uncharacterized protein F5891DRAFT_1184557 [Suillus fuscotomentosus]|uniref:Uncharacterized protein n=1 Tax=Suillus fuscotomentosus TaxID=1912939 RepID=A0AAD4HPM6_9AGAM|nr:uncharacterized protein F5891DRAFT_1184557 [Suillus fuscotomentosus]KAG1904348.1 hypothetical protein F5891DRAFT_1184557 [Suillus fuscotomentosus]